MICGKNAARADDAGGEPEAELGVRSRAAGLGGRTAVRRRRAASARPRALVVGASPAVDVVDEHVVAPLPGGAGERDELEEEDEEAEGEQQGEASSDEAVAAGAGRLDRVAARNAERAFDEPGAGQPVAADQDQRRPSRCVRRARRCDRRRVRAGARGRRAPRRPRRGSGTCGNGRRPRWCCGGGS